MKKPSSFRHWSLLKAGALLASVITVACNQTPQGTPAPQPGVQSAPSTTKVYVVFDGPWAFAADPKDANSVLALAPKTKAHRDLFVQTWDKTLTPGIYDLSIPARNAPAAGTVDPNILQTKIDAANVQHVIDNKLERYAIRLPKPEAYVAATHYRSRAGSTYPPDASTEKDYVTTVSLRYSVTTLNGFSLAGSPDSGAFNPLLLQVETPTINFVIHPAHDFDPTDRCNTHSRQAFRDLTRLINVTLFVDFPNDAAGCHDKDPQNPHAAKAGLENRSPAAEIVALLQRGLAAIDDLFGAGSGSCRAPIIVGS